MTIARFSAWFDWHGIDGVVDGTARMVRMLGSKVAFILQRGQIQMTLYYTISFAALFLVAYVWL
jgi:multicomponent Na+:H+ antiporter subunit D